ncbi:MarR family winged helix-turn-helix transcriptional regulator [Rhizobium sp.]|uniref:MarR family winged helix-turn-helix transcriptional regulator n=1 Tax=Rhizobium sp. TaxID=391 RepID=UPI0028AC0D59
MPHDIVKDFGYLTLGTRLRRLGEMVQANTQLTMQQHGIDLPAAHYPFLAAIDCNGPLTVGELADVIGISQPGATRTIGRLAEAGLLDLSVSDGDQRRKQVSLTKAGQDLVDYSTREVWPGVEAAVRNLCTDLDGSFLDQLASIEDGLKLRPLIERMKEDKETK